MNSTTTSSPKIPKISLVCFKPHFHHLLVLVVTLLGCSSLPIVSGDIFVEDDLPVHPKQRLREAVTPESLTAFYEKNILKAHFVIPDKDYYEATVDVDTGDLTMTIRDDEGKVDLVVGLNDKALQGDTMAFASGATCNGGPCDTVSKLRLWALQLGTNPHPMEASVLVRKGSFADKDIERITVGMKGHGGCFDGYGANPLIHPILNLHRIQGNIFAHFPQSAVDSKKFDSMVDYDGDGGKRRMLAQQEVSEPYTKTLRGANFAGNDPFHQDLSGVQMQGGPTEEDLERFAAWKFHKLMMENGEVEAGLDHAERMLTYDGTCTTCYEVRVAVVTDTQFCIQSNGKDPRVSPLQEGSYALARDKAEEIVQEVNKFYQIGGLCTKFVISTYFGYCDTDPTHGADDADDPFIASGDLSVESTGCAGDGAIDAIEKLFDGQVNGYPSRMGLDWDIAAVFTDNFQGTSSFAAAGCASTPGIWSGNLMGTNLELNAGVLAHEWGHNFGCQHTYECTPVDDPDNEPANNNDVGCLMRSLCNDSTDVGFCSPCFGLIQQGTSSNSICNRINSAGPTSCVVSCSGELSSAPSESPSQAPSSKPSESPSKFPSQSPSTSRQPSKSPSSPPTSMPSKNPSSQPTGKPSQSPTLSHAPSSSSEHPSMAPTLSQEPSQSSSPSTSPSQSPSTHPSVKPSAVPSTTPSDQPTNKPSVPPSEAPSSKPSQTPSIEPTRPPSATPSATPSSSPTMSSAPSMQPSTTPSRAPSVVPSSSPTVSVKPSAQPSFSPSESPTLANCFDNAAQYGCEYDEDNNLEKVAVCLEKEDDGKISFENKCEYIDKVETYVIGDVLPSKKSGKGKSGKGKDGKTKRLLSCGCCDAAILQDEYNPAILENTAVYISKENDDFCFEARVPTGTPTSSPSISLRPSTAEVPTVGDCYLTEEVCEKSKKGDRYPACYRNPDGTLTTQCVASGVRSGKEKSGKEKSGKGKRTRQLVKQQNTKIKGIMRRNLGDEAEFLYCGLCDNHGEDDIQI